MAQQFRYLFTPLKIRPITVKNRIVLTAHETCLNDNHLPTERYAYYLAERAKGGAGLIITSIGMVHPSSFGFPQELAVYDRRTIPGFRLIADMVHQHGAKILGQLAHSGRNASGLFTKHPVWAPSPVPSPRIREIPHAMTGDEIQEVKEGFVTSASNFKAAGFDGIELHGAHGYLLNEFMSPFTNKRTDAYGGSLENRLRFVLEVIDSVRKQIGNDMVLGIRISGDELVLGGLTLDDMKEIAVKLEQTGELDYISVSVAIHESHHIMIGDMSLPLGAITYLAAGIKEVVNLPVFTALRINDPVQAEQILADGKADMIGMTRALICDPELPNKSHEGKFDDIRKCMACNQECHTIYGLCPLSCSINPAAGSEKELGIGTITPAATKKRVTVVGGGPGGLEAARILALRRHQVTLYEKANELGGQVNIAAKVPSRTDIGESIHYLALQVKKLGVDIRLGAEVTADDILREKPEAVVIATGSTPLTRSIPGAAEGNIKVINVWEAIEAKIDMGDNVVIFDYPEAFWQCYGTAEFLAAKGKKVTVVTPFALLGLGLPGDTFINAYQRLLTKDVSFVTCCDIKAIKDKILILFNRYNNREQHLENIDTLILSLGNQVNDALYHALRGKVKEIYAVGDCVAPRKISEAVREGHMVGRRI